MVECRPRGRAECKFKKELNGWAWRNRCRVEGIPLAIRQAALHVQFRKLTGGKLLLNGHPRLKRDAEAKLDRLLDGAV